MDTVNATLAHGDLVRLPPVFYEQKVMDTLEKINTDEWFQGYAQSEEYRRLGVGNLLANFRDRMVACVNGWGVVGGSDGAELKLALYAGHDTTVAATLASLGCFDKRWPRFAANIVFELFEDSKTQETTWWSWITSKSKKPELRGHYVRLIYNDTPMVIKGCRAEGRHMPGDRTMCTLVSQ